MNNYCKYCLDDSTENDQPIIFPCQCSDGVHPSCLTIWLMMRPRNDDKFRCEICHANYIGIVIPPSPPVSPQNLPEPPDQPIDDNFGEEIFDDDDDLPNSSTLEFLCCQCQWFESISYILGTVLGVSGSLIYTQPGYRYRPDTRLVFNIFIGVFVFCYTIGIFNTSVRYYRRYNNGRRVYNAETH